MTTLETVHDMKIIGTCEFGDMKRQITHMHAQKRHRILMEWFDAKLSLCSLCRERKGHSPGLAASDPRSDGAFHVSWSTPLAAPSERKIQQCGCTNAPPPKSSLELHLQASCIVLLQRMGCRDPPSTRCQTGLRRQHSGPQRR
mmetsp:Transcript_70458/g.147518  ORF Transcript_70458/g.147518 Transcript_70458/m.147518 type:complete len:143 (+) Transcript_70458:129-557(+)